MTVGAKQTIKVRLSEMDRTKMRAIALTDGVDTRLNDITARAVEWAFANRSRISPVVVPRSNRQYISLYVPPDSRLPDLVMLWDCTQLEALYSALRHYIQHRELEPESSRGVA